MATVEDVVGCYEELRDKLHDLSGDSDFEDGDRNDFRNRRDEVGDAAEAFSERPKYGPSSDNYDPALTAGRNALNAAGQTTAADDGSIRRCKQKAETALNAIASVTN